MATYALHGFLGKPSDWKEIFSDVHAPDLFKNSQLSISEWTKSFNESVQGSQNTLLGYSMGGRLALHALIQNPILWKNAVIISASPGIENTNSRIERLTSDTELSQKFVHATWNELMEIWNNQSLFDHFVMQRDENDFDRISLANALINWSVGNQHYLKKEIENLEIPILWIVGENDTKYVSMAHQVKFKNDKSKISIAPQAGHRVPWQKKQWFQQEVEKFL